MKRLGSDHKGRIQRVRGQDMDANTDRLGGGGVVETRGYRREDLWGPSGWWTWPRPPPSSTQRRRSWVFHGPGSCSWQASHPSHRSAAPGKGSRCSERPASGSGFCSACLKVTWGWFCVETQRHRSGTECVDALAHLQWLAESVVPRRVAPAWGPKTREPKTQPSTGFSWASWAQPAAGCWGCQCCSPLPDWGCPF